MINANELLPGSDMLFMVLDTLRYDVAQMAFNAGDTPNFANLLPTDGWEKRHAPATFTYPSHHAMFSGFLPTPTTPGNHHRLIAMNFLGSETIGPNTAVFDHANFIEGLSAHGYKTVCIGGVGFFNMQNQLGSVFPSMFQHAHWSEETSVTNRSSTSKQFDIAIDYIDKADEELLTFINVSALHQPNWFYLPSNIEDNNKTDTIESHYAALQYIDEQLPALISACKHRIQRTQRALLMIICSDHGTLYGDDGYNGHRIAHENVLHVPYLETVICP